MKLHQIIMPVAAICCATLISCDSKQDAAATYAEIATLLKDVKDQASADATADKVSPLIKVVREIEKEVVAHPEMAEKLLGKETLEAAMKLQQEVSRLMMQDFFGSSKLKEALMQGMPAAPAMPQRPAAQ